MCTKKSLITYLFELEIKGDSNEIKEWLGQNDAHLFINVINLTLRNVNSFFQKMKQRQLLKGYLHTADNRLGLGRCVGLFGYEEQECSQYEYNN